MPLEYSCSHCVNSKSDSEWVWFMKSGDRTSADCSLVVRFMKGLWINEVHFMTSRAFSASASSAEVGSMVN